jgi:hypothetical protein
VIVFGVVMIESAAGVPPRRVFRYAGMDVIYFQSTVTPFSLFL